LLFVIPRIIVRDAELAGDAVKAFIVSVMAAGLAACATSGAERARPGFLSVETVFLGRVVASEATVLRTDGIAIGHVTTLFTFEVLGLQDTLIDVYDTSGLCSPNGTDDPVHLVFVEPVSRKAATDKRLRIYACPQIGSDVVRHLLLHQNSLAMPSS
jgi:hypothetical protein